MHYLGSAGGGCHRPPQRSGDRRRRAGTRARRHRPVPRPLHAQEAGICLDLIAAAGPANPHVRRVPRPPVHRRGVRRRGHPRAAPIHGKLARSSTGERACPGVNGPFEATRYHSLVVRRDNLPADVEVTAEADGLIMASPPPLSFARRAIPSREHPLAARPSHHLELSRHRARVERGAPRRRARHAKLTHIYGDCMEAFKPVIAKVANNESLGQGGGGSRLRRCCRAK